jgi:hypothetical protein
MNGSAADAVDIARDVYVPVVEGSDLEHVSDKDQLAQYQQEGLRAAVAEAEEAHAYSPKDALTIT